MMNTTHFPFALVLALIICGCTSNSSQDHTANVATETDTKDVLLIGTFHFNNPGKDVAKTKSFDILKEETQKELDEIASNIKAYSPTKIFVEWPHDEQMELDSLYDLYRSDSYFNDTNISDFHKKNEIFQLAFRTAKLNNLDKVHAIDYNETEFPFDSLMKVIAMNDQKEIEEDIFEGIEKITTTFDNKISEGISLKELIYYLNSNESRRFSNKLHNETPLLVGDHNNFIGPYLTAEWYKRNLYMRSLIQKKSKNNDQRIMVLVGASHAAIMKHFIDDNSNWSITELVDIMN